MALLVAASLSADAAWCVLTLVGVEGGHSMGSQVFHSPRLPWSHSGLSTAVLSLVFAFGSALLARATERRRLAGLAALAVWLHLLLGDLPFGEAFPLAPWTAPLPMPHLYASWVVAFVLETLVVVAGVAVVAALRWGWRRGRMALALLVGLHLLCWLPTFAARPALDLDEFRLAIVVYLVLLFAAWVACIRAAPPEQQRA